MTFRRLKTAALFATIAMASSNASACWLTDWLYGRPAAPYAAGYAPVVSGYSPYTSNMLPLTTTSYTSSYAPLTSTPYVAPVQTSGVFQAQRPAYPVNNPSVYTGMPVAPVGTNLQTAYSLPLTSPQLRGPLGGLSSTLGTNSTFGTGTNSSYLGAANVYPNSSYYRSNYSAAQVGIANQSIPVGTPPSALPATNVAPLFPNAPRPSIGGGLSRFFGSLFGTNYRSSYYRAPITYYRPVTTVDPTIGTTVTVQQPCTSTVQQLQRTPYSSLQMSQPIVGSPNLSSPSCGAGCGVTPYAGNTAIGQSGFTYDPATSYPQGNVGQVGAVGASPGQFTTPIPSTAPQYGNSYPNYQTPAGAAPLTGTPLSPQSQSDLAPVEQPSLNSFPRGETSFRSEPSSGFNSPGINNPAFQPTPANDSIPGSSYPGNLNGEQPSNPEPEKSYWQLQDAADSTAMIRSNGRYQNTRPSFENRSLTSNNQPTGESRNTGPSTTFTGIQPIRAFEDSSRSVQPVQRLAPEPPPLPARSQFRQLDPQSNQSSASATPSEKHEDQYGGDSFRSRYEGSSASFRRSVPVREAAARTPRTSGISQPMTFPPNEAKRDNTWTKSQ